MKKLFTIVMVVSTVLVSALLVGCQEQGLTEAQIRSTIQDEINKQYSSGQFSLAFTNEFLAQLSEIQFKNAVASEVAKQIASIDVLTLSQLIIEGDDGMAVWIMSNSGGGLIQVFASDSRNADSHNGLVVINKYKNGVAYIGLSMWNEGGELYIWDEYGHIIDFIQ